MGSGNTPAPPPPPPVMPTIDSESINKARKKAVSSAQQRGGRASTILSEADEDKLG